MAMNRDWRQDWRHLVRGVETALVYGPEIKVLKRDFDASILQLRDEIWIDGKWYKVRGLHPHTTVVIDFLDRPSVNLNHLNNEEILYRTRTEANLLTVTLLIGALSALTSIIGVIVAIVSLVHGCH